MSEEKTSHLNALRLRLSHEKSRPVNAMRAAWIAQIEKEIRSELEFLGIEEQTHPDQTDVEILNSLGL